MLINDAKKKGDVHEVKLCMDAPIVSHLLLIDDSFFFFRADEREVVVRRFLDDYVATSGKYINLQKSEVTISRNVDQGLKNDVI